MNLSTYLANLLAYSVQVAVLVGIGTLLALAFRIRHPGTLLLHWRLLLAVCLVLPAIQPWNRPAEQEFLLTTGKTTRVQITLGPAFGGSDRFPAYELLASGAGLRWSWLILGLFRLGHYRRKARLLDPTLPTVQEMQVKMGVAPRVYLSTELDSPVTFGLRPPVMLLPSSFPEMQPILQKAIACHELWHIRRRDWILTLLEGFLAAPFWFHPAVWWLLDRIQLCREQVVDRLVLKTTQERKPYLEALLQTALAQRRPKFTPATLFLSRHHLTQRVVSILKEVSMSKTRLIASLVTAWLILFLTGKLAVQVFPLESAEVPESQSTTAAQPDHGSKEGIVVPQELLSKRLVHQVQPTYPPEAKQLGIQGEVLLEVSVSEKGDVSNIRVTKGHPLLVLAALEAVKQWKYMPYLVDGVAVPVSSMVSVNFTLQDSNAGALENQSRLIRVSSGVMATNLVYRVEPIYPLEAKQKGIAGEVVFEVTINEQGELSDVQVLAGNALLVSAAYEAVRQWRYTPVLLNGDPIRAKSTVTIQFELERDKDATSKTPQDSLASAMPNPPKALTTEERSRRIAYANARFAADKPGSETDRGRVYVAWGPPDEIEAYPSGNAAKPYPFEIWRYLQPNGKPNQRDVQLEFAGTDYKLTRREVPAR